VTARLPLYCANASCKAFVGKGLSDQARQDNGGEGEAGQAQEKFLTCGKCHVKTCRDSKCKRLHKEHLGVHAICPDGFEDEELRKVREEKGWKRCPRCWALTEKSRGCDGVRFVKPAGVLPPSEFGPYTC